MGDVIYDVYPAPKITGNYYKASDIRKVVKSGNLVLVCTRTELRIMDLSAIQQDRAQIVNFWKGIKDSVRAAVTEYERKARGVQESRSVLAPRNRFGSVVEYMKDLDYILVDDEIVYFSLRSHLVEEDRAAPNPTEAPKFVQADTLPERKGDGKGLEYLTLVPPEERKRLEAIREFNSLFKS